MWLFLTILVAQESDNFHLVFSEKYFTHRCIFAVFVGGGELHALLFYHLGLLLKSNLHILNMYRSYMKLYAAAATKSL